MEEKNLIKIAIQLAGGRAKVAYLLKVDPSTLTRYVNTKSMPAEMIGPLARAGGVLTSQQILEFIEANSPKKVAA